MAGNDSDTVLLLHCNGEDESTDFPDDSVGGTTHEVTAEGNAQVDTTIKKFGTGSAKLDGTGDYLSVPDSADWNVGLDDFTVDMWIRRAGTGTLQFMIGQMNSDGQTISASFLLGINADNTIRFQINDASPHIAQSTGTITDTTTWHHLAGVRDGNTLKLFIDGTLDGTEDVTGITANNATTPLGVGRMGDYNDLYFVGYIDEVRVSKGIARWTEDFDVPTEEYTGTNTKINVGDVWKDVDSMKINIGDAWKDVDEAYINIGDSWKQFWSAAPPLGDRGVFGGGWNGVVYYNEIDYITISTTGNATDFGDLTITVRHLAATSNGAGDRGVFGGGTTGSDSNIISYITISSPGDATGFGDLTAARRALAATSNGTNDRGVFAGGLAPNSNIIDYITISSIGNATDFGDLTAVKNSLAATSNGTNERGVFMGGDAGGVTNVIEYITISSLGNATDFGYLTVARWALGATSNGTNDRGVFGGGYTITQVNTIDYITISTTPTCTDFGDLTVARDSSAATSNGTSNRGVFGGGYATTSANTVDYITISSVGDAADFGDLTVARQGLAATSNA